MVQAGVVCQVVCALVEEGEEEEKKAEIGFEGDCQIVELL